MQNSCTTQSSKIPPSLKLWRAGKSQKYDSKLKNILPVKKYRISGNSMSPLLKHGNIVLVIKYFPIFFKPNGGDIVACKSPLNGKTLIKRITKIENNRYFVEGDNKAASMDSRDFGLLEKADVIGKMIFVL